MKIAHFGTFDVDNYGDLLFPYIARYRYPDFDWYFVSPTNSTTQFKDSLPVIDFEEANKEKFDGIIIGGGNIIHTKYTSLETYKQVGEFAYPNLWIGAAKMALKKNISYAFNAPGISNMQATLIDRILFRKVFSLSSYISLREEFSVNFARQFSEKEVKCIPDTAIEISKVWPLKNKDKEQKLVINLNDRYHKPAIVTANLIDQIAEQLNLSIELVVIGDCHGDLNFTKEVYKYLRTNEIVLKETQGLKELAHTIAKASFFIGSSMHAFITALSYKTPCLLVLNEKPMHKFIGLVKTLNLDTNVICSNWGEAMQRLKKPALVEEQTWVKVDNQLNVHWTNMIGSLQKPIKKRTCIFINNWKTLIKFDRKTLSFRSAIAKIMPL